jgi:hypothetical protein
MDTENSYFQDAYVRDLSAGRSVVVGKSHYYDDEDNWALG